MVFAERAGEVTTPSLPRGLGLGDPGLAAGGPLAPEAVPGDEPGLEGEPPAAGEAPTGDDLRREVLWLTRAVEECGRAFTRLTSRLGPLERRLDLLEAREAPPPPTVTDPEGVQSRLEQAADRLHELEVRVRQLDFLPLKVSNLHRALDQLSSGPAREAPPPATAAEVSELRRELAAARRQLEELDGRLATGALSAAVEAEVRRHADRLAAEIPCGTVDVDGLYRELDAVAEFVAARAAATAESIERIGPLEVAVLELRRELRRAVSDLASSADGVGVDARLLDMDARLRKVESSGKRIDRLYAALVDMAHVNPDGSPRA